MQMTAEEMERRHRLVRKAMAEDGIDVLVVGASAQWEQRGVLRYLTDYYVPIFEEFVVIPMDGPVTFFAHYSYGAKHAADYPAIKHAEFIPIEDLYTDPGKSVANYVKKFAPKRVGIAGMGGMSARFYLSLVNGLGAIKTVEFSSRLSAIRMIKSAEEIQCVEKAMKINEEAFSAYLNAVRPGGREIDAINEASYVARKAGAEDMYFMVGSGDKPIQCSIPLALQKNHIWKKGDLNLIIIEISGPGGYYGEIIRLISIGEPSPAVRRAFEAVAGAQKAAESAIRPGATVGQVADVVDGYLIEAGYYSKSSDDRAQTTTGNLIGHGMGLDVLEMPVVIHGDSTTIQPGMQFNIHPNISLPDGIRVIECECYLSTETTARRLSTAPVQIFVV